MPKKHNHRNPIRDIKRYQQHLSVPEMRLLFESNDEASIKTFLKEHHFKFDTTVDFATLIPNIRYYFEQFTKEPHGVLSTEHPYPLSEYILLRINTQEPEKHLVHSRRHSNTYVGNYFVRPRSGKISTYTCTNYQLADDDKFCLFLGLQKYVQDYISDDCLANKDVSSVAAFVAPSQYPLSKAPLIIKHAKDTVLALTVLAVATLPIQSMLSMLLDSMRLSHQEWEHGRRIIPSDEVVLFTLLNLGIFLRNTLALAVVRAGVKEVRATLNPTPDLVAQHKKECQPSLKGLLVHGMFAELSEAQHVSTVRPGYQF